MLHLDYKDYRVKLMGKDLTFLLYAAAAVFDLVLKLHCNSFEEEERNTKPISLILLWVHWNRLVAEKERGPHGILCADPPPQMLACSDAQIPD